MTKDELLERLKKENESTVARLNPTTIGTYARGMGYSDGLGYAVGLVEKLDEPKKVVIPQFVADWIEEYSGWCSRLGIVNQILSNKAVENDWWLNGGDNQELLLKAIANGYEVEKEKKYRVKLPGLIGSNGQQYISKSMDDKLFACAYRDYLEQEFTKEELEKFPNWVQQLEFEEVEDE